MKILSIDTSCDETSAAVTVNTKILSNIIWSQASLHAKFGGVYPSLAKREHIKRIDWIIEKSLTLSKQSIKKDINAVAVTVGPGLAIALEVGINKAKEISRKYNIPFLAINHIEGHVLSSLASAGNAYLKSSNKNPVITFPALGIVTSGGHTQIIYIKKIGIYEILASTVDDALGEGLDKAARMLGLGYPGGPILEKLAKVGNPDNYTLPIPLIGQEKRMIFSYSGLKTSFFRLVEELKIKKGDLSRKDIADLSASFQNAAFQHFIRVLDWMVTNNKVKGIKNILAGGGVMANVTLRKMLRRVSKKHSLDLYFPYTKRLYGDNAAMIGIAAYYKAERNEIENNYDVVEREPNAKIDKPFNWKV